MANMPNYYKVHTDGHKIELEPIYEELVPVVRGRWLKTQEPLGWQDVDCIECSCCRESWVIDEDYSFEDFGGWNYCPNCGAKMDLEGQQ